MANVIVVVLLCLAFLVFLAGSIWLQIFLSKKQNKWLGLIIPLICFVFSIMAVLSLAMYTNTAITSLTDVNDGAKLSDKINYYTFREIEYVLNACNCCACFSYI